MVSSSSWGLGRWFLAATQGRGGCNSNEAAWVKRGQPQGRLEVTGSETTFWSPGPQGQRSI